MKSPDPQFPGAVLPAIREAASLSEPYSKADLWSNVL